MTLRHLVQLKFSVAIFPKKTKEKFGTFRLFGSRPTMALSQDDTDSGKIIFCKS